MTNKHFLKKYELFLMQQLKHDRCITAFNEIKEFIVEMEKKQNVEKFETIKDKPPSFPPTHIFSFSYFWSSRHVFPLYGRLETPSRCQSLWPSEVRVTRRTD